MKTRGKTMIAFIDKSGRLDEVQLQQDIDSIKEFYQNKGYIDVEVKDVREERQNGPIVITIAVVEGPQYHVEQADLRRLQADDRGQDPRGDQDERGQGLFAQGPAR